MTQHIKIGGAKIRMAKEANGIAWSVDDAYNVYCKTDGLVAYDACDVISEIVDADDVEESLRESGEKITNRRPVYWCDGPEGFVVHELHDDEE